MVATTAAPDTRVAALVRRWAATVDVGELTRRGRRMVFATGGSPSNPSVVSADLEGNAGLAQGILDTFDDELPSLQVLAEGVTRLEHDQRFSGIRDPAEFDTWARLQARHLRQSVVALRPAVWGSIRGLRGRCDTELVRGCDARCGIRGNQIIARTQALASPRPDQPLGRR